MYPCVFGGLDSKPQSLQSFLFSLEIGERNFECDVINGGCFCARSAIAETAMLTQGERERPLESGQLGCRDLRSRF